MAIGTIAVILVRQQIPCLGAVAVQIGQQQGHGGHEGDEVDGSTAIGDAIEAAQRDEA